MKTRGRLTGLGITAVSVFLAIGAKCPPPFLGHRDGGVSDGGDCDGPKPPDAGGDVGDAPGPDCAGGDTGNGDASGDASPSQDAVGGAGGCVASDPNGVWETTPHDSPVRGAAALASNDVWVADDTTVQHWDGSSWTTMLSRTASETFGYVWASGAHDVWVGGDRLRRWNGTVWADAMFPITNPIRQIWGLGPNDVWVIAERVFEYGNPVYHWNGIAWTETGGASGLIYPDGQIYIESVWGASPDGIWGFGWGTSYLSGSAGGAYGEILRWAGGRWELFGALEDPSRKGADFRGATGRAADDMWIVGPDPKVSLRHFDGTSLVKIAQFEVPLNLGYAWVSCAGEVWFPVVDGHRALLAHYNGATSSIVELPGAMTSVVTGTSGGEIWAGGTGSAGGTGALFHLHSTTSTTPACGNARIETGEQCDPPNGMTCDQSCQRIPTCGDGIVDGAEQCDPPAAYTCSASCRLIPACGNGRLDPGEECDTAMPNGYLICDSSCHYATCGNGRLDPGEECDPPLAAPGIPAPWCDSTCHIPRCGNGVVDPGETCDPPLGWSPGHMTTSYCGSACTTIDACAECRSNPMSSTACQLLLTVYCR